MSKVLMPRHGNQRYPWEKWEDGRAHRATKGQHFTVAINHFRRLLFMRAERSGKKVKTAVRGNDVFFTFEK